MTEDDLIATLFAPLAGAGGLGLLDDAALLPPDPGYDQVVTVDALVAGVHFFADDAPESIARKALRVNLSDLAAKGAQPVGFVLAIALPADVSADWLRAFALGLGDDTAHYACPLLGGDTVKTPGPLTISITALGRVPAGRMVRRTGASAGDSLYVTGTIGDAALGLKLRRRDDLLRLGKLTAEDESFLTDRYLHPQPRLPLRQILIDHASGAMDVSDGLVGDLVKMLKASGTTGRVTLDRVPLSPAAQALVAEDPDAFEVALTGGDDYEILASVPEDKRAGFESASAAARVPVSRIGEVLSGTELPVFLDHDNHARNFGRGSFSHF